MTKRYVFAERGRQKQSLNLATGYSKDIDINSSFLTLSFNINLYTRKHLTLHIRQKQLPNLATVYSILIFYQILIFNIYSYTQKHLITKLEFLLEKKVRIRQKQSPKTVAKFGDWKLDIIIYYQILTKTLQ